MNDGDFCGFLSKKCFFFENNLTKCFGYSIILWYYTIRAGMPHGTNGFIGINVRKLPDREYTA